MGYFDLQQKRQHLWQQLYVSTQEWADDVSTLASQHIEPLINTLAQIERFWTYPGRGVILQAQHYIATAQLMLLKQLIANAYHQLQNKRYQTQAFNIFHTNLEQLDRPTLFDHNQLDAQSPDRKKPYFEVLIVHPYPESYELFYRQSLAAFKTVHDEFIYDIVFVSNAEDALTAIIANTDIQACVYLNHIPIASEASSLLYQQYTQPLLLHTPAVHLEDSVELNLCRSIKCMRPELNHLFISELSPLDMPLHIRAHFDRVLFHVNPFHDLHLAILSGIRSRFSTPFFDALQAYSRKPKGVFHALPLSRGASVKDSPWIGDMLDFYGDNIFLAEKSSTLGGLDSLLDPTGAIKQAHIKTAETFAADSSYFVTNGTSTSNKIVMQANLKPGDIVLISADCHKSIPYSVMLAGAYPIFLETYPLVQYDLYGGIDLEQIKRVMLDLKKHNRLDKLKQITLTNSTFDGLIYNSEKFMLEILAIKPDIIFHWDEAWFAFAHFHPLYHSRTAMSAVQNIRKRMQHPEYHLFYAQWRTAFDANLDENKWLQPLYPDPNQVKLRVYVTQSTHKTLTAFRQGSMIHIADTLFDSHRFLEAFRIHTSTSPNYQIIASLDIARRQAALEGFSRVRESILLSLQLKQRIRNSTLLQPYFTVLDDEALIPTSYRSVTMDAEDNAQTSLATLSQTWANADFVIDPTRITLDVSKTGIDGSSFRQLLMNRYDIQVNKTSRHTVLFLINIGATQATIDYLIQVLTDMASKFNQELQYRTYPRQMEPSIPLPEKRVFHPKFMPFDAGDFFASDIRHAYFEGLYETNTHYAPLSNATVDAVKAGEVLVSASFVTPYPPGFPVVVPGQIITVEILTFFQHIKVKEIHGFNFELGFKVFTPDYLAS